MNGSRGLYIVGFSVFALVIIFSIAVEVGEFLGRPPDDPEVLLAASVADRATRLKGVERRRYLLSIKGRQLRVAGEVVHIGLMYISVDAPGDGRVIRINVTRRGRNEARAQGYLDVTGTVRRVRSLRLGLAFELSRSEPNRPPESM